MQLNNDSAKLILCKKCFEMYEFAMSSQEYCEECQHKLKNADVIGKNPMMIRKFVKIFKRLCPACRGKAMRQPSMKKEQYCSKCQEMIDDVWDN